MAGQEKNTSVPMLYTRLIVIKRDDEPIEVIPYGPGQEQEALEMYEKISAQWSDVFLCTVDRGPLV